MKILITPHQSRGQDISLSPRRPGFESPMGKFFINLSVLIIIILEKIIKKDDKLENRAIKIIKSFVTRDYYAFGNCKK